MYIIDVYFGETRKIRIGPDLMWFDLHSLLILEKKFTQHSSLKSGLLTSFMISHKKSSPHLSRPSALGKRGWSGAFNRNPPKVLQLAHSSALPLQKNASTTLQKKQCNVLTIFLWVAFLRDSVRFLEPIKCYKLNDLPKSKVIYFLSLCAVPCLSSVRNWNFRRRLQYHWTIVTPQMRQ